MTDFFDALSVTESERAKLRALGVTTPLALLSLRKAATQAFDDNFGAARAHVIADQLKKLLSDAERESLSQPIRRGGSLGARLDPPPTRKTPPGRMQK